MRISNSKAKTWRRCPKQFNYKYVQGLRTKSHKSHLELGSWFHELLELFYTGGDYKAAHKRRTEEFNGYFQEEREEMGDLPGEVARLFKSYRRRYAEEDKQYKVIDAELDEIWTLPSGLEFNFIIDLIVEEEDGGIWLWDHKTLGNFMPADFMLLDTQLARYFYCAEAMGYTPLRGVMFNEVRTKAPTIPDVLKKGGLSRAKNIDTDYYTYMQAIREHDLDPADYEDILARLKINTGKFFRRTQMPKDRSLTATTILELEQTADEIREAERLDRFPRTVNKSCQWDCDFKDLCITELMGGDPSSLIKTNFERRNKDGRKSKSKTKAKS